LGVVSGDFDGDGWLDVFVANDQEPDYLWLNSEGKGLRNDALLAGVGVNTAGLATSSMGVDAGDLDNDGDEEIIVANLSGEPNSLFVSHDGLFQERSLAMGLAAASMPYTGFGIRFFDYDSDGWLDIVVANGEVREMDAQVRSGVAFPLRQRNQLFRGTGDGGFEEVTDQAGPEFALAEVTRGVAAGDVDGDGDLDLLLLNNNGRARLLINEVGERHHWLGVSLETAGGRPDLGATAVVRVGVDGVRVRRSRSDGSYLSASDPRVHFGLGTAEAFVELRARWTSGAGRVWTGLPVDRYLIARDAAAEGRR
jgi:hypothetical protein